MKLKENEEKKKYLIKYRETIRAVEGINEQINELRSDKLYPSFVISNMPSANKKSDLSEYAAKLDELINLLTVAKYRRIQTYKNILTSIEQLEEEREREILMLKYIKGMKWEEVAVKLNLEWAQLHRIHGRALKKIEIIV